MNRLAALLASSILLTGAASHNPTLTERQRAQHALNRLAFGPRAGDLDRILETGVDAWIDQQLHPERIADRAVEARLQSYSTLQMSDAQIWQTFYAPVQAARKEIRQSASARPAESMTEASVAPDSREMRRKMREALPAGLRPRRVMEELESQRIIRAAESERQLNEVMTDFWMNHFNVYAAKGVDRFLLTGYERDTIRPHIWGRFEDLLMATAKSPAMLFYLDNAKSAATPENRPPASRNSGLRRRAGDPASRELTRGSGPLPDETAVTNERARNIRRGLNENYAREIMELHTLGAGGGYTQSDVTQLARVLTGWTIGRPQEGGGFVYRPQLHDTGEKTVLGVHLPAGGGMKEGEQIIRLLAHHPATAHHIAYKLCQRLVADDPSSTLVDRVAKRFLDTGGDLRETVKAVIASPEFWSPAQYRTKVKSPFEYAISAVRAVGARLDNPLQIARALAQLGEPLYHAQPPTGYSDRADAWINTGALMARLNFALDLTANRLAGAHSEVGSLLPPAVAADTGRSVDALALSLTGGELTSETRATIKGRVIDHHGTPEDPQTRTKLPLIAGLIIGSPEFQRQ